jgi:hypothetical protein
VEGKLARCDARRAGGQCFCTVPHGMLTPCCWESKPLHPQQTKMKTKTMMECGHWGQEGDT